LLQAKLFGKFEWDCVNLCDEIEQDGFKMNGKWLQDKEKTEHNFYIQL